MFIQNHSQFKHDGISIAEFGVEDMMDWWRIGIPTGHEYSSEEVVTYYLPETDPGTQAQCIIY